MALFTPHIGPLPYGEGFHRGVDDWPNVRRRLVAKSGSQAAPSGAGGGVEAGTEVEILPKYLRVQSVTHGIETKNDPKVIWKESNDINLTYTFRQRVENGITISKDTGIFTFEFAGVYLVHATLALQKTSLSGTDVCTVTCFKNGEEFVAGSGSVSPDPHERSDINFGVLQSFDAGDEMTMEFDSTDFDGRLSSSLFWGYHTVTILQINPSGVFA